MYFYIIVESGRQGAPFRSPQKFFICIYHTPSYYNDQI